MAIIFAFLDEHDLLEQFVDADRPAIPECISWRKPTSLEAKEIFDKVNGDKAALERERYKRSWRGSKSNNTTQPTGSVQILAIRSSQLETDEAPVPVGN